LGVRLPPGLPATKTIKSKGAKLKVSSGESKYDTIKWLFVASLTVLASYGNFHYQEQPLSLRLIGLLIVGLLVLAVGLQTQHGKALIAFARQAKTELRKVVWPSRQETVRMTFVVVAMICVASALMWCLDAFLFWAIGLATI
jgi:preprotein translocase subunit SecE